MFVCMCLPCGVVSAHCSELVLLLLLSLLLGDGADPKTKPRKYYELEEQEIHEEGAVQLCQVLRQAQADQADQQVGRQETVMGYVSRQTKKQYLYEVKYIPQSYVLTCVESEQV